MDETLALADGGVDASAGGFDWGAFASNSADLIKQAAGAAVTVRNAVQKAQAEVNKSPAVLPGQISQKQGWGAASNQGMGIKIVEGLAILAVAYLVLK